jgi:hypothetical protein
MKKSAKLACERHGKVKALLDASSYASAAAGALNEAVVDSETVDMRRSLLEHAERSLLKAELLIRSYGFDEAYRDRDIATSIREAQQARRLAA